MCMRPSARQRAAARRADETGPAFFSGEEALREVAKPDGSWDWALLGPDPVKLPLAGGGMGGVDEMAGLVGQAAHSFGLLRMTFGTGAEAKTKCLFIHASDPLDSGNFTQAQHGRALANKPAMMKAVHGIAACAADVNIQSAEECTVENMISKLREEARGAEAKLITVENFNAAVEQLREEHPEMQVLEDEREDELKYLEHLQPPRPEVVQPEMEASASTGEVARLRKKLKLYRPGDSVEVWSAAQQRWMLDGEVAEVARQSIVGDNHRVPEGSHMVVYDNGALFEWIAPNMVETHLRPSLRPRSPPAKVGPINKETHGWFTVRHMRYVEVSKGFLRWWDTEEGAKSGTEAPGMIYLLHLQQQRDGKDINLRSASTKGKNYTFEASSEEEAEDWVTTLWMQAAYCQELRDFTDAQAPNSELRKSMTNQVARLSCAKMLFQEAERQLAERSSTRVSIGVGVEGLDSQ